MTPQLLFIIGALLLLVATLVLLLLPFRRRQSATEISRKQLNAAIYRDEFAELERDLAEGSLSQADYEQARAELQRRLLEDSDATVGAAAAAAPSRRLPVAMLLALPVAAAVLYLILGNPAALNPPSPERRFSADDIERMVAGLAEKLEKEPGNQQGWVMLARSYKAMGRLAEAAKAYERAGSFVEGSADLLLDYADTQASVSGFSDKVRQLIDKALKLEPTHPMGLWLRGTAAYEAKQYGKAVADWETLLKQLPPDSEDAKVLQANIAEVRDLQVKVGPKKK
jgi:cytochrome c-type biogenesis protein CcmH